ncbi:TonB-dependent receptor [Membranihabitans marinus]
MVFGTHLDASKAEDIDIEKIELKEALQKLTDKYDVYFTYDKSLVKNVKVNYEEIGQSVSEELSLLLAGTDLHFKIFESRFVIIYKLDKQGISSLRSMVEHFSEIIAKDDSRTNFKPTPTIPLREAWKPEPRELTGLVLSVSGQVVDQSGEPLIGVNVMVKGTSIGGSTDFDGKYTLNDVNENATLVFSYIGYQTIEIPVDGRQVVTVTMLSDSELLDEIVVVGYGSQKKANLTGAVGVASSERLENRTITSLGQGLQGVIPGLNITYANGDPNEGADFNIRGFESINGGSPLILVDGVPMDAERINPNDVQSVSVLKDASSAAIYGARAAFGVILIETKKGEKGKNNINFSTQYTSNKAIFPGYEPVAGGGTARQIQNEAYKTTVGRSLFPDEVVNAALAYENMENPSPEDAWLYHEGFLYPLENSYMKDLVLRDYAPQKQMDFSINGANEKASYYVSLGLVDKEGFFNVGNEQYNRYNALTKTNFQVTDWLSLDNRISFSAVKNDNPHEYHSQWYRQSIARHFYFPHTFPDLSYYKEPGDRDQYEHLIGMGLDNRNPTPYLENGGRDISTDNDIWLTQGVTVTPLKGLKLIGDFSYRYYWNDFENVASKVDVLRGSNGFELSDNIIYNGISANDYIEVGSSKNTYYVLNTYAEYTWDKWSDHMFKGVVGFNQEYGSNHSVVTRATQLLAPNIASLSAATGLRTNSDSKNEIMLRGVFYRFNYNYKEKYLFEANGRYDGTSRFPSEKRFGFFPSFSAAWRITQEPFMAGTRNWLDNLKIRASYGELGNQAVGSYYPYISSMASGTSNFLLGGGGNLTNIISPGGLVSNSLTWESVTSRNVGIDFSVFNTKFDFSLDYFIRETKDMLMQREYPGTLGATSPNENAADLRNNGWEVSVTYNEKIGEDLQFRFNVALSDYTTEITKYDNPTGAIDNYYVGKKVGEIWGYETVGLYQTQSDLDNSADQSRLGANWKLGDVQYADLNGDGVISSGDNVLENTGDLVRIGNSTPRYSFGLNPSVKYKNFSLNVFFQGILKKDWYPSRGNFIRFFPFKTLSMEQWWLDDSWSEDNRDAYFPGVQFAYSDNKNTYSQTRYLQNAAYIRLKNLTLGYDIPISFLSSAHVYVNGANLWEATGMYKTLDPEYSTDLIPDYMFQRSYTVGLRITF